MRWITVEKEAGQPCKEIMLMSYLPDRSGFGATAVYTQAALVAQSVFLNKQNATFKQSTNNQIVNLKAWVSPPWTFNDISYFPFTRTSQLFYIYFRSFFT